MALPGATQDGRRDTRRAPGVFARTFADVAQGGLLLYEDAYRTLALAVNRGSAAERLGLALDDVVVLEPGA